jgi:apolipoprotein N-acyltransferase
LIRRPLALAAIVGALAAAGFAPLGLWPLTLLCLAGLIELIDRAPSRQAAMLRGWWFGVGYFTIGLNWIAHAFTFQDRMPHGLGYVAVILLSLYLAVYPAVACGIAWRFGRRRRITLVLWLAASWLLTEYLRATLFTGFAWNPLGVIWLGTGVDQAARLVGTYGLGALAVLAGGGLWMIRERSWQKAGALLGPIVILAAWGHVDRRLAAPDGPRITVVQPNINQNEKQDPALEWVKYRRLAKLSGRASSQPRLLFWPEAAVPAILDMEPDWRLRLAALLGPNDLLMLGGDKLYYGDVRHEGTVSRELLGARNALWVLTPDARLIGRYDKAHLVPYGEYLPMRTVLSAIGLSRLVPGDVDFWPGPGPRTLDLPGAPGRRPLEMGVQICYEIIFSGQVIDAAHRPDFLFNPSNDAWFGAWGPPQHLAQARLRAIEEGVPVIRSTPTGISAVVDARGNLLASVPHGQAGAIDSLLPAARPAPLFARVGNVLPLAVAALLILIAVALRRRTR